MNDITAEAIVNAWHRESARLEVSMSGDEALAELVKTGARYEAARIERELRALFEANVPLPARPLAAHWISKVEKIIRGEA